MLTFILIGSKPRRPSLHTPVELFSRRVRERNVPSRPIVLAGTDERARWVEEKPALFDSQLTARSSDGHEWIALLQGPCVHDLLDGQTRVECGVGLSLLSERIPEVVLGHR